MEKATLTVKEAAKVLGVGINAMYELVRAEGFPVIQISKRRLVIPKAQLERWVDAESGAGRKQ